METDNQYGGATAGVVAAAVIVGIGVVLLLRNLGVLEPHEVLRFWPLILVAFGLVKLLEGRSQAEQVVGGVMMAVGGWLLADALGLVQFHFAQFWPLLIIGVGVYLLWMAVEGHSFGIDSFGSKTYSRTGAKNGRPTLNEQAAFGGGKRQVITDDFQGGRVKAVFGGYEIDLRRATMLADEAVVDVEAAFGGIEFWVPQNWLVDIQGKAAFGAFEDKTMPPPPHTPGLKRLIVRGKVSFGAVGFRN